MDNEMLDAWIEVRDALSNLKSKAKWFVDKRHEESIVKATDKYSDELESIFKDLM